METELGNYRPKQLTGARLMGALAMMALLAPMTTIAQGQASSAAQIGIVVDAPSRYMRPDSSTRFLVRVSNTGTGLPVGSRLQIPLAEGLTAQTWTCIAHSGANCSSPSGSGAVDEALGGLSAGGWIEYALAANVAAVPPAFVSMEASATSAATVRCAGAQTQPCRSLLSLPTGVSLYLEVDSGSAALQPGGQVSYTIVSRSVDSHSSTDGSVLRIPVPNGLTNSRWTCSSSAGACATNSGNGPIEQVLGDFSGGEVSFHVNATVTSTPPATIVQAAAITPPHGGSCAKNENATPTFSAAPCVARIALATSAKILVARTQDYRVEEGTVANRFVLENSGSNASGSVISTPLPVGVVDMTWRCSAEGATCPQGNGAGAIEQVVGSWPTSGRLTYDFDAHFDPANASVEPIALKVSPPATASCGPAGTPPPCQSVEAQPANAVFELQQHASRVGALPGQVIEYSVDVANVTTDITAHDVVLNVPRAKGIEAISHWSCSSANPAIACPVAAGSGPILQLYPDLAPGSRFTYLIQARVAQLPPAIIDAQATLTSPAMASMGCVSASGSPVSCSSATQFSTVPILALEQSATARNLSAGGLVDYVLDIFNLGADAGVVNVRNVMPESLAGAAWVCNGLGMGCPSTQGSGNIAESIAAMPEGSSVRYSLTAQVNGALPESITNVLIAAPDAGGRCHSDATGTFSAVPCSDRFETRFSPAFELSQSSAEVQLLRGGVVNYAVTLKNSGAVAGGTQVAMRMPVGISRMDWTCSGFAGATCPREAAAGELNETIAAMPANGFVTYSIKAILAQDAPTTITNQVTSAPELGAQCAGGMCSSSLSLPVTAVPSAHLQVSVHSPSPAVQAGGAAVWVVDVRNLGNEIAGEFSVRNAIEDSGFEPQSWTCEGAECPAPAGSGALAQTVKSLAVFEGDGNERQILSGRIVFRVIGVIRRQPDEIATLSAVLVPAAGDTCGPVNCQESLQIPVEVLGNSEVTIELSSPDFVVNPDSQVSYSFTLTNSSGSTLANLTAYSIEPPEFTSISWTCASFGGAACPASSGTGTINELIGVIPPESAITYQITANTGSDLSPTIDFLVGANVDVGVICVPASCTNSLSLPARDELTLTLIADVAQVIPDTAVNYTYRLENTGGGTMFGILASSIEPIDFAFSSWTCVATGGASCTSSGVGPINDFLNSMPSGSSVTYSITAFAASDLQPTIDFEVQAGQLGQVAAPTGGLNCVPATCSVLLSLPRGVAIPPTLSLTKTADQTSLQPGGSVRYNVVLANTGDVDAANFRLTDAIPPGLTSFSWTCSSTGNGGCPNLSGAGAIDEFIEFIAAGSTLSYVVDAVVSDNASGTVENIASLVLNDPTICVPIDCSAGSVLPVGQPATLRLTKTANQTSLQPGGSVRYNVVVTNTGNVDAANFRVTDSIPPGLTSFSWTCSSTGNGGCPNLSGTGAVDEFIEYIAAGSTLSYVVDAVVSTNASGTVGNVASLVLNDLTNCVPLDCSAESVLPVGQPASLDVSKTVVPASGTPVGANHPINWTLRASNTGGATQGNLVLVDRIPTSVVNASVLAGAGVTCNTLNPQPGASLTCTIAAGFTGQRTVGISATVSAGATGSVINTVNASGSDGPVCSSCTVSNPILAGVDSSITNPRAYVAGSMAGTLFDIVNMSTNTAQASTVVVTPASSIRFLAPFASGCTATPGPGGSVVVSCPSPPSTQGVNCSGSNCTIATLTPNTAVTLFVSLNPGTSATVQLNVSGDSDPSDNTLVLPPGGTP